MSTQTFDRTRLRPANLQPSRSPETAYDPPLVNRSIAMSNPVHFQSATANTTGWVTYTYASFLLAVIMTGVGIWAIPADYWVKGYMTMAAVFLTGATFTLAKTVRDEHEAKRFANRLDEAKTEKLLMEINRG